MSIGFAIAFALAGVAHGTAGNIGFLFIDLMGLAFFGVLALGTRKGK